MLQYSNYLSVKKDIKNGKFQSDLIKWIKSNQGSRF